MRARTYAITICSIASAACVCALAAVLFAAQTAPNTFIAGADRPLSLTVKGSLFLAKPGQIDLLVLWRGRPGWYLGPAAAKERVQGDLRVASYDYGELHVEFIYDAKRRVVRIDDVDVPLGRGNTVMVDNVDVRTDRVVNVTQIDLSVTVPPGSESAPKPITEGELAAVLRRSPEVVSFLQCDVAPPKTVPRSVSQNLVCKRLGDR